MGHMSPEPILHKVLATSLFFAHFVPVGVELVLKSSSSC